MKTYEGILDRVAFPTELGATVVEPGVDHRIHGFAVQTDLSRAVGFTEVIWLSLTGELPDEHELEAFTLAMIWLAPVHVGELPAHAAVLAKVAGAPEEMVPAIATVGLGQLIAAELADAAWLGNGAIPAHAVATELDESLARRWEEVCGLARRWFGERPWFDERVVLRRVPAALALLHELGIRDVPRLQALATIARLPVVLAEAACMPSGAVMRYPTSTPVYRYVEDEA